MKKVFSLMTVMAAVTFVSCGPSAEEQAKLEAEKKRIEDSIAAAINAAESAAPQTTDSAAANTQTTGQ